MAYPCVNTSISGFVRSASLLGGFKTIPQPTTISIAIVTHAQAFTTVYTVGQLSLSNVLEDN